ncbi:MAG: T9SS type A sorting domain-containing protein [Bacteroidia bacterium]
MRNLFTLVGILFIITADAQVNYKTTEHSAKFIRQINPRVLTPDFNAQLFLLEAPLPGGSSYRSFLLQQKIKQNQRFKDKEISKSKSTKSESGMAPILGKNFGFTRVLPSGTEIMLTGGIPNDNTLAVSNGGVLLAAINSLVYAYDLDNDTIIFPQGSLSLRTIAGGGGAVDYYFDPKLIYDEQEDRFILVFLKNADPASNGYIVAFSSSSNPLDPWNTYFLSGNPLNNERWTDFPAISLSAGVLYITGNLIIDTAPTWQEGFDGSIIWKVNTAEGYAGAAEINSELYSDIKFNDRFIRNLHPVQGARGQAEEVYFMSNRNFDLENDTMFVLQLKPSPEGDTILEIKQTQTDTPYGMPPNAKQADTDPNDPTGGLQTNDARVLGAILLEGEIKFVANTINPETGFSSVYYGKVSDPSGDALISGMILGDSLLDYGYPNIAFAGNENCDAEVMIGFNYSSPDSFPGIACKYIDNEGNISETLILKQGEGYVDRLTGTYERWGDYLGFQTRFNQPGKVYSSGYYGLISRKNASWVNEIISPDTTQLYVSTVQSGNAASCTGVITTEIANGRAPFTYFWNSVEGAATYSEACNGQMVNLLVSDSRGCSVSLDILPESTQATGVLYPNPFVNQVNYKFLLEEATKIEASIYDVAGKLVAEIIKSDAKKGLNELQFNLDPLAEGVYFLRIFSDNELIMSERLVKASD